MSRYKITDQHGLNFLTLTVVDWVDVFIRKSYKDILIESLQFCQKKKGLAVYAYVIMSSHVHLIAEATGEIPLSDILRDFKKYTAQKIDDLHNNSVVEGWVIQAERFRPPEQPRLSPP